MRYNRGNNEGTDSGTIVGTQKRNVGNLGRHPGGTHGNYGSSLGTVASVGTVGPFIEH